MCGLPVVPVDFIYFKELEQPEINIQASHAWLKK
jgi:hypothetical protein